MDFTKYDIKDATHELICRHYINPKNNWNYKMKCIVVKELDGNRSKIIVFGRRYWEGYDHVKNIRYVDNRKLIKLY